MTRTRSFVGSTVLGYIYQASVMVVGLWLTPFYLRTLGRQGYGLWLVGLQVLTIILLMDFGVVAILPRDIAQLSGKIKQGAGWDELLSLVAKTTKIVRWQTVAVSVASIGSYFLWPGIAPEIRGPLGVAILVFCLSFPLRMYAAILEGLQDLHFLSQLRIALWVAVTTITVILLLLGWRLYALAVGWSVNLLAFQLASLVRLRMRYPTLVKASHWFDYERLGWRDFARGSWVSVGQVSQILLDGTYIIVLARILGPAAVVVYTCTGEIATVLANQPQLFVLSALPGLSQMKTSAPKERIGVVTTVLGQGMLIISGAMVSVAFSINEPFVQTWVGPQLFGGRALTGLILTGMFLRHLDLALAQALFAMGHERALAVKALADGVVTTITAFLAIHWLGLYGAALAQIIGNTVVSLPTDIRLFSKEFKISAWEAVSPYVPYIWRLTFVCAAGNWLARYLNPHTYPAIAGVAIIVLIFYFALVLPYAWRTPLGNYLRVTLTQLRASIMNPRERVPVNVPVEQASGGQIE